MAHVLVVSFHVPWEQLSLFDKFRIPEICNFIYDGSCSVDKKFNFDNFSFCRFSCFTLGVNCETEMSVAFEVEFNIICRVFRVTVRYKVQYVSDIDTYCTLKMCKTDVLELLFYWTSTKLFCKTYEYIVLYCHNIICSRIGYFINEQTTDEVISFMG